MTPALRIELSDFERIWGGLQSALIDPAKNTIFHVVPLLGAFYLGHSPIVPSDCGQKTMIPPDKADLFFKMFETLRTCAQFSRKIHYYTSLIFHFTSLGGSLSLTPPVLIIPYTRLFRPADGTSFCDGSDQSQNILTRSDEETQFYLAREIGHLKYNNGFLKTAAKIAFIVSVCSLYSTPFGWLGLFAFSTAALLLYNLIDRAHESSIDFFAVKTLSLALGDSKRAAAAAISALKKERDENCARREQNLLCRLYLTPSGNNLLDIHNYFLTSRIKALESI